MRGNGRTFNDESHALQRASQAVEILVSHLISLPAFDRNPEHCIGFRAQVGPTYEVTISTISSTLAHRDGFSVGLPVLIIRAQPKPESRELSSGNDDKRWMPGITHWLQVKYK